MRIINQLNRSLDQLKKEPGNSEYYNEIGVLLYQLKDYELSERYLQMANKLESSNLDILYNYGFLLLEQSRLEMAEKIYSKYLEQKPEDDEVKEYLYEIRYRLGHYEMLNNR